MTATKPKSGIGNPQRDSQKVRRSRVSFKSVVKYLVKMVLILVALVLYSAVAPIFVVFMVPLYAYRGLVILLQKAIHPDWIGIMSSRDAIVGLDDTTKRCECMIIAILAFKGVPNLEKCQEYFQKNVMDVKNREGKLWYRKLTHYYENWLGFPFWKKDKNFKLENHLRMFDYDIKKSTFASAGNGNEEYVTEEDLLKIVGDIEPLPFAKGRSPWEILVLPNYVSREGNFHKNYVISEMTESNSNNNNEEDASEKSFALVYRVHHAIGDGYSFLKMLMCHMFGEPIEAVPKPPERKTSFFVQIFNMIAIFVLTPYYHFKQFVVDVDRSLWHLPTSRLTKHSHFVTTDRIPMDSLKRVGKAYKVPLTGVFLAGLCGGVHNFLKLTGKGHRIPQFMRALSPMPWMKHPAFINDGMVNHWTAGVFAIPVAKDTPQKRLRACKRSVRDLINSPILITNFFTVPLLLSAPNFLTDFWGTNWMSSMILSNFPGPKHSSKGFGKYLFENIITYVPQMRGSAGIGVMFPTALENMRCTISVDSAILKNYSDAQLLVSLIEEEFKILRSLPSPHAENIV